MTFLKSHVFQPAHPPLRVLKLAAGQTVKAKFVVGDPSYFPGKVRLVGKVVRAIAIMVSCVQKSSPEVLIHSLFY